MKMILENDCVYLSMATLEHNRKSSMSNQISCVIFIIAHMYGAAIRMRIHVYRLQNGILEIKNAQPRAKLSRSSQFVE